jgi:hypothetical protein
MAAFAARSQHQRIVPRTIGRFKRIRTEVFFQEE